jgi:putrescine transport system substrate-binding protein
MRRAAAALLGATLGVFSLVACSHAQPSGARQGAPGAPPPEERVLRVYNWDDYIGHHTIADFERLTGIKVIYDLFDSNQTLEAKLLIGDSGYDIVSTSEEYYARQIRAGLYEPLDKAQLPNWKNLDPEVLAIQAKSDPGNRYAAGGGRQVRRLRRELP